jgi:predicted permease
VERLRILFSRLKALFRSGTLEADLDSELQAHLDALTEQNILRGLAPDEARAAARREFGGLEQTKEAYRAQRSLPFFESLSQDVRFGLRMLRKSPVQSLVCVAVLAIGIGTGTALYSLIDACLLHNTIQSAHPADRWEVVRAYQPDQQRYVNYLSVPEIRDVAQLTDLFESVGAIHGDGLILNYGEYPERIPVTFVTASGMAMTNCPPVVGRIFREDEDRPGGPPVAVLSYQIWQRRFSADRNVLGQIIRLNDVAYTVIGVMPQDFEMWGGEVWIPLQLNWAQSDRADRHNWIIALLRPGVTEKQADARLLALSKQLAQQFGSTIPEYRNWQFSVWNIDEAVVGGVKPALLVLAGAAALLLIVVCANVAILQLVRASSRMREVALRMTLGARRGRILRQVITENLILSFAGGALGICLSLICLPVLVHLIPPEWLPTDEMTIRMNHLALEFAVAIAVLTGLLFGAAPAFQVARQNLTDSLKEGGQKIGGDRRGLSIRNILVVAEIALSLVVLAGAALMGQSYRRLEGIDLGFRPDHLLSFSISLPATKYSTPDQIKSFFDRSMRAIDAIPSVDGASAVSGRPMIDRTVDLNSRDFTIEGRSVENGSANDNAYFRVVTPGYFRTMGIRLLRGRIFAEQDGPNAPRTTVVNDAMARLYWPAGDAIGHRIQLGAQYGRREAFDATDAGPEPLTIVGVVSDVRQVRSIDTPVGAEFYLPLAQQTTPPRIMAVLVRSTLDPAQLTSAVRLAVASMDPAQPIYDVETMDQVVADSFGPKRLTLVLLLFVAAVVLVLAAVGLYATLAYAVAQRSHEMAVRSALGAQARDILRLIIRHGAILAATGVLIGLAAALLLTRLMQDLLYGTSPFDPLTFAAVSATLVAVALVASYIPARRALQQDPITSLRE